MVPVLDLPLAATMQLSGASGEQHSSQKEDDKIEP